MRQNVDLLYKVFGEKNSEDIVVKAGSICVSVVFRPIASVSLSGKKIILWYRYFVSLQ